jgi:hypothetical protein
MYRIAFGPRAGQHGLAHFDGKSWVPFGEAISK